MARNEQPMHRLQEFIPPGSFDKVVQYLHQYKVELTITRQRKTLLGVYRNAVAGKNHRISINGNLNKYDFLITLLHELAHLLAFELHGPRIMAHGKEWKEIYKHLLASFLQEKIFPEDISRAVLQSLKNPGASACGDLALSRVLKQYDSRQKGILIETLAMGTTFRTADGRSFTLLKKNRTRYVCSEIPSGKLYTFSALYEVFPIQKSLHTN